ncbi:hypothetical protein SISNIDRAFT_471436 [Sistotremastrum niveocremeum HHB9708]|uniref:Uncharacterized protein n=1 Tax=Sistotremastrum niveocremeum HHB9708 TaxID=1314777 RepID=A0A164MM10_9AGAM|nr:hypothetical protein SISNIDRAFT_471436 [Sistotremastrum niveocremeum HHB9708]
MPSLFEDQINDFNGHFQLVEAADASEEGGRGEQEREGDSLGAFSEAGGWMFGRCGAPDSDYSGALMGRRSPGDSGEALVPPRFSFRKQRSLRGPSGERSQSDLIGGLLQMHSDFKPQQYRIEGSISTRSKYLQVRVTLFPRVPMFSTRLRVYSYCGLQQVDPFLDRQPVTAERLIDLIIDMVGALAQGLSGLISQGFKRNREDWFAFAQDLTQFMVHVNECIQQSPHLAVVNRLEEFTTEVDAIFAEIVKVLRRNKAERFMQVKADREMLETYKIRLKDQRDQLHTILLTQIMQMVKDTPNIIGSMEQSFLWLLTERHNSDLEDMRKDIRGLIKSHVISSKIADEVVARLSRLAQELSFDRYERFKRTAKRGLSV